MKRLVSVAAIFLTTSSAYAITCATLPDCSSLGYTDTVTDCPNDYVSCPMDMTLGTCLNRAKVGRIGFFPKNPNGTTSGAYKGWLFLDGDFYNKDMYPELAAKIDTSSNTFFRVPDLRGDYIKAYSSETTSLTSSSRYDEGLPNITATWYSVYEDKDSVSPSYATGAITSTMYDDASARKMEQGDSSGPGYLLRSFDASKYNDIFEDNASVEAISTPVYAYIYAGKKVTSASNSTSIPSACTQGYYYYTDGTCSATRNTSKTLRGIVYSKSSTTSVASVTYIWGGDGSAKSYNAANNRCQRDNHSGSVISPSTAATYLAKASGASFVSPVYAISTSKTYWSSLSYVYSCSSTTSCSTSSTPTNGTYYYYYCQATDYFY